MPANFVSLGRSAGLYVLDPKEFDSKEELRLVQRQSRAIDREDRHDARYRNRGTAAKLGILKLFGANKADVHANKVAINQNINQIAVRVAEDGRYRKIYRGSTMTDDEVAALLNAFDNMSLESNCTAAYFLLHGKDGNGYPPSFSTDRRVTEPYAKTDLKNWPKHVNTVLITVKANGPNCYVDEDVTHRLKNNTNTGALGVTTEEHPYGHRHEVVLDNRNTYHITHCRRTGGHLALTMVASGETDRGLRARDRARYLDDEALRPPRPRHRRTHSMPGGSRPPVIGAPVDVRHIQHQGRVQQARRAEQARQAQLAPAAQMARARPAQYIQYRPPPVSITDPSRAVVPPHQPFIHPPGWTAHVDHRGYTRFLPVQYMYRPAPVRKKGFFNKLFNG